jgi:Tol biopolymer transport system component
VTRTAAVAGIALVAALAACSTSEDDRKAPNRTASAPETSNKSGGVPLDLARRRLIFTRENGTYIARADGSHVRRLVDLAGVFEFQADVSPDGKRVLLRVDDEGAKQGTWMVGIDGTRLTQVAGTQKPVLGGAADWAPDGKRFVLTGKRANEPFFGLYVLSVDGRSSRRITPDTWEAQYPAWSPDGRRIAFTRAAPPNTFDIWVVNTDGTGLRRLTGADGADNYAAWSPDGKQIVYSSEDRSTKNGLWVMNGGGSGKRHLVAGGEPQWEPGRWIVFDCALETGRGQACAVRPDGSGHIRLPLGREAGFPNWLP